MSYELNEQQARWQYKLLGHDGHYTRVRCQNMETNRGTEELLKGEEQFIRWASGLNGKGNLFLGRNPRDQAGNVICANSITLDLDPVRPAKEASTEDQHRNALRVGQAIITKYGNGNLCSSGNGALLIFPLEQPIDVDLADFEKRCKFFEQMVRDEFQTPEVRIDSTYDLARLVKAIGSTSTKGDKRSWRQARFLHSPVFRVRQSKLSTLIGQIDLGKQSATGLVLPEGTGREALRGVRQYGAGESVGQYNSRSEADVALAHRLKLEGLGPADVLEQLGKLSFRPERADDHRRIVEKLFSESSTVVSGGTGGERVGEDVPRLWTPAEGLDSIGRGDSGGSGAFSTGFAWLDAKLNGGFQRGSVFTVQAVTNAGKSTFLVQTAFNVCRSGKRVLYVTTESNLEEFCTRYRALGSGIGAAQINVSNPSDDHRKALASFDDEFKRHQIHVFYSVSPKQQVVEKFINDIKPDIVLWDYFQHYEAGSENRTTVLADLARWYQGMALKYDIPFVVAAQLHSVIGDYKQGKRRPASMHDVKDSKVINDVSKTVLVIDWLKDDDQQEDAPALVRWAITKNKGRMATTQMVLERSIPRFIEP